MPDLDPAHKKFLLKERKLTLEEYDLFRKVEVYKDVLNKKVIIDWACSLENSKGVFKFDVGLKNEHISIIERSNLYFFISASEQQVELNQFIKINIELMNKTDTTINCKIHLIPGIIKPETVMSWVGSLNNIRKEISPGSHCIHPITLCFHKKGVHKFKAICRIGKEKLLSNEILIIL